MVEQVRHHDEQRGITLVCQGIGDGRCQVCLAAAVRTGQYQPATWSGGKSSSRLDGFFQRTDFIGGEAFLAPVFETIKGAAGVQVK
jgi:hypothetical protein